MDSLWRPRRVTCLLLAGLILASACQAIASEMGAAGAALVRQDSYFYFMDEMLYTHAGDNRGFGPEHDLAQANIVSLMEDYGLTVTLEPVSYGGETYFNVVGTKLGSVYPEQEYIIGGHYDSVSNPGADDNASGVALVLESARVLTPFDSDYTIRFVAFDREEQGLHGSQAYVNAHMGDDILGMISADMVAYNNSMDHFNIFGRSASNPIKNALAQAIVTYGDGLSYSLHGSFDASDHAPFEWAGFDACLLIEDYWDNPYYHLQQDNIDMPSYLDFAYATQITRVIVGFLVDNAGVVVVIPRGDFDGDGDVDQYDSDQFEVCFTGPGGSLDEGCERGDFDDDDDIDCDDWEEFKLVWTGPPTYPPFFLNCDVDCNGNTVADEFDIAGGTSVDCQPNGIPDECDLAEGTSQDLNTNGIPDECDAVMPWPENSLGVTDCTDDSQCDDEARCVHGICYAPKQRYLSIVRNPEQVNNTARRVRLDDGTVLGWVGAPYEVDPYQEPGTIWLANIVDASVYSGLDFVGDWPDVLHATGCKVAHAGLCDVSSVHCAPNSCPEGETCVQHSYHIQAIAFGADPAQENNYSEILELHTNSTWGDTVSTITGDNARPPDGIVGLEDITAAIRKYQLVDLAPIVWLDIHPSTGSSTPDQSIGVDDIINCIDGYQGKPYPGNGPLNCP